ncbi:YjjG family noncanonical pyrimidine nucleotidase [Desertivirga arenae]|uniref:YjjG family noncanonical pyrimidine nucleotidase n=1 Tax=Desertivirga arenae TaxID=2810309 RepID=UPI001A97A428|nr:YjjG family noncanonical pyrimidine nucleotidase [Pedobacter sp. SYSU D00823]
MYKHIFFDLDHTIWDFDKNAEETLTELFEVYSLCDLGVSCSKTFIDIYTKNNHELWTAYHLGKISKQELRETRFKKTFLDLGLLPETIPAAFEDDYVRICPTKTNLFPEAHETLKYLSSKYSLHLISNGFKESTEMKIELSDLGKYFENIIISEVVGVNKPDKAIFEFALKSAGAKKEESLMIGDSLEADIRGALAFGIDAIYFNPEGKATPLDIEREISHLKELKVLL